MAAFAAAAKAATDDIVVTQDSGSLRSGCRPQEAAELLGRLSAAVNSGDRKALDRLFAIADPPGRAARERPEPFFRWFSLTEGQVGGRPWRNTVLYDRDELLAYMANRHRQNERWRLVAIDVGSSWVPGGAGIGYAFRREADDLPSTLSDFAVGKGEIDCVAGRIYVWSMGQADRDVQPINTSLTPCPQPAGWTLAGPIIACSRSKQQAPRTGPNAQPLLADFRLSARSTRLPHRCGLRSVRGTIRTALVAFNAGDGDAFVTLLTARAPFEPYRRATPVVGRALISRFISERYAAGDGWTGAVLRLKASSRVGEANSRPPRFARYRLSLLVSSPGRSLATSGVSVSFDCRSGLIGGWVGPPISVP